MQTHKMTSLYIYIYILKIYKEFMKMEEKSCGENGSSWRKQPIFMYEILK